MAASQIVIFYSPQTRQHTGVLIAKDNDEFWRLNFRAPVGERMLIESVPPDFKFITPEGQRFVEGCVARALRALA